MLASREAGTIRAQLPESSLEKVDPAEQCVHRQRITSAPHPDSMNLMNGPMAAFFVASAALMASGFAYAKLYLKK